MTLKTSENRMEYNSDRVAVLSGPTFTFQADSDAGVADDTVRPLHTSRPQSDEISVATGGERSLRNH